MDAMQSNPMQCNTMQCNAFIVVYIKLVRLKVRFRPPVVRTTVQYSKVFTFNGKRLAVADGGQRPPLPVTLLPASFP